MGHFSATIYFLKRLHDQSNRGKAEQRVHHLRTKSKMPDPEDEVEAEAVHVLAISTQKSPLPKPKIVQCFLTGAFEIRNGI